MSRLPDPQSESSDLEGARLSTSVVSVDGHAVVLARGEIDPSTAEQFASSIDAAFTQAPRVVVDMSDVSFMDSTGIRALVQAFHRSGQNHEALVIRSPSEPIRRLLTITGLDEVLEIEEERTSVQHGGG
jgi:stage II sporulation protein AA (anti-sigma F factor antagonist)